MICGTTGCGCAIQSESLQINGTGGVGSPYTIETNAFAIVTSVTRPSSPFTNQFIYETDTGLAYRWSGSAWQLFAWTREPACVLTATAVSVPYNDGNYRAPLATEVYDPLNWHSAGNVTRITPTIAGRYEVQVGTDWQNVADYNRVTVGVMKNGAHSVGSRTDHSFAAAATYQAMSIGATAMDIAMNGTTDYVEVQLYHTNVATAARTVSVRVKATWKGTT